MSEVAPHPPAAPPSGAPPVASAAARRPLGAYASEAAGLGLFMLSASAFAVLLFGAGSPVPRAVPSPDVRRDLMGLAMGATAVVLLRSPIGTRSGGHFNPAVTLAFLRLGMIGPIDAAWYVAAQVVGGAAAMLLAAAVAGPLLADPAVGFVATLPGPRGPGVAWAAEFAISVVLLLTVLVVRNLPGGARAAPWVAGTLVALFIAVEAPLSGMSLNPARTIASAVASGDATSLWVYLTAPTAGMLVAAEAMRIVGPVVRCARVGPHGRRPCHFPCQGEPS